MARTELTSLLRRIHRAYRAARRSGRAVEGIFEEHAALLSRRRFLAQAAGASASLATGALASSAIWPLAARASGSPRIAIVGGGLAGISCAYRLMQAGLASTVFEAGGGAGGRTWTLRDFFHQGQIVEHGGEFISSEHTVLRKLAAELGLQLDDLRAWDASHHGVEDVYYVRGQKYALREMLHDYGQVFPALEHANAAAGVTRYNHYTHAGYTLDHVSARDWIVRNVPGGLDSKIGWLLDIDTTTENGGDSTQQNALTMIYMLAYMPTYNPHGGFYLVGTDERYRVRGGNDQIVTRMAAQLPPSSIRLNTRLEALRRRADGSYVCSFSTPGNAFEAVADHVVLALPFVTLRDCDLTHAGFSAVKMAAIKGLPMGTNTKLHVQFSERPWFARGSNGATYSDTGYQQTWEDTRAQTGTNGVLVNYTGGIAGASWDAPSFAPATPAAVEKFLAALDPVYPGIGKLWNGKAFLDNWSKDRWHRGSYSYWGLGNCTTFTGIEPVRQGNVHFCGEHTSLDFQGFMNGAVVTGEAVAYEIVRQVKGKVAQRAGVRDAV